MHRIKNIFILIGLCIFANNLYAVAVLNIIKEQCGIDFNSLASDPIKVANQWINSPKIQSIDTVFATIWDGHPAVRFTRLSKITDDGFLFYSNPRHNMVKHFKKMPAVALDIIIHSSPNCIQQIRVEGRITTESALSSMEIIETKNSKAVSSTAHQYTIKPNWIQFSTLLDRMPDPIYMDQEYTSHNEKWKKDSVRSLERHDFKISKLPLKNLKIWNDLPVREKRSRPLNASNKVSTNFD